MAEDQGTSTLGGEEEVWRPVSRFPGRYEVSSHGRVRALSKVVRCRNGVRTTAPKFLKPGFNTNYFFVVLCCDYQKQYVGVHQLVAEAFIPNPEGKPTVNHKDAVKTNNHVSNLEWATRSEQRVHAMSLGFGPLNRGEENGQSKLTREIIEDARRLRAAGHRFTDMAAKYGVRASTISGAVRGVTWKN